MIVPPFTPLLDYLQIGVEKVICPYCQKEMEPGFIQSRDSLVWSNTKRLVAALPLTHGELINLADNPGYGFSGNTATAYCCKKCKKVIIDISETM